MIPVWVKKKLSICLADEDRGARCVLANLLDNMDISIPIVCSNFHELIEEYLCYALKGAPNFIISEWYREFSEIKADLTKKIEELEKKKTKLLSTNDNYQEYLSQGGEIMKNIATRYISASPIGKKQIIGSIFAEKLIFSENKFRTTEPNVILELISRPRAGSDDYKKQKVGEFSDLSTSVPRTGTSSVLQINVLWRLCVNYVSRTLNV